MEPDEAGSLREIVNKGDLESAEGSKVDRDIANNNCTHALRLRFITSLLGMNVV